MEKKYTAYNEYEYTDMFGTVVKQTVIKFFTDHANEEFSVLDISKNVGLNQSSLSKPLDILSESGLLESREDGKFRYYQMKQKYAKHFQEIYGTLHTVQAAALRDLKLRK